MVDGAAWLEQLEATPGEPVLLDHATAITLARTLAGAQAVGRSQVRMADVIPDLAAAAA